MTGSATVKLGLIGDNIARSRSPDLHRIAGALNGLEVTYDLLVPPELGLDFDTVFQSCAAHGYRGVNVTYPYKEIVAGKVGIDDPLVRRIGAVNTVVFQPGAAAGYNTDYSGFVAAYRAKFAGNPPGTVLLIGAGGVGRAIAFALVALGVTELRVVDRDGSRADILAAAVRQASGGRRVTGSTDISAAAGGADGIVNCTPVGMTGYPGSPIDRAALGGQRWAFDAVYTPVETAFKADAEAAGLDFLSGYELFFHQGIQAFRIFTGRDIADTDELRRLLKDQGNATRK